MHRASVRLGAEGPLGESRVLLAAGVQSIQVENTLDRELVMRLERTAPREDALTAAKAACLPSFRELFPGEVLASGRLVAVGRTAFLIAHIQAQRQLMNELGDARAFELMLKHLEWIEEAVAGEGGAVVKTATGGTLCAFDSASAAARAALTLRMRLVDATRDESESRQRLDVRVAVHQGPAVAATVDGRLDYFGHTVETAYDLIAFTTPHQVLLSAALAEDADTIADLTGASHTLELVQLEGALGHGMQVTPALSSDASELGDPR
jgi:class 3 adenylate cyclase